VSPYTCVDCGTEFRTEMGLCGHICTHARREPMKLPRVLGVGRVADNAKALIVYFEWEPSDDDLRVLHESLR
jgi:hypothetical protein